MKSLFYGPTGKLVEIKTANRTIGSGESGAKSAALRGIQPLIETMSVEAQNPLINIPLMALTPSLLSDFLKRAGVSHENPEHAEEAIRNTQFLPSELEAFKEAMAPFAGLYIAVRSDECTAAGVGLWHTDFMIAGTSEDAVKRFAEIAKEILISDFSLSSIAFKKRIGAPLEQTPGILVMPVVGSQFGEFFFSYYSVNAITCFMKQKRALVSVGTGIGGANNYGAKTTYAGKMDYTDLRFPDNSECMMRTSVLINGELAKFSDYVSKPGMFWLISERKLGDFVTSLYGGLNKFTELTSDPKYLELVLDYNESLDALPNWAVVQCADCKLKNMRAPAPAGKKILDIRNIGDHAFEIVDFGSRVLGRDVIETNQVLFVPAFYNRDELIRQNQELLNYTLVFESSIHGFMHTPFGAYSNASAIILWEAGTFSISTHLGGALREAGIVVLAGNPWASDQNFLDGLELGINERKLQIYANDGVQEGFVASLD